MPETTLLAAVLETAARANAGFASTAESGSSTDALLDVALRDASQDPNAFGGGFVYRPDAASADRIRGLPGGGGFNPTSGRLIPTRIWGTAPAADEAYQLYAMLPPRTAPGFTENWVSIVNRALRRLPHVAELVIGVGNGRARNFTLRVPVVTLLMGVAVTGGSAATVTTPAGWTLAATVNLGTTLQLALFTRRSLVTDPMEWTVTLDSARAATGFIAGYVDANPSAPLGTVASATATAATVTAPIPSTTLAAGQRAVSHVLRFVAATTPVLFEGPATAPQLRRVLDVAARDGAATQGLALFEQEVTVDSYGNAGTAAIASSASAGLIAVTVPLICVDAESAAAYVSGYTLGYTPAAGATSFTIARPLNLPNDEWVPNRQAIRKTILRWRREGDEHLGRNRYDVDANREGRYWRLEDDGTVFLNRAPGTGVEVVLSVQRPGYPPLVSDLDETTADPERLTRRALVELYDYLNGVPATRGKYQAELAQAYGRYQDYEAQHTPGLAIIGA